MNLTSSSDSSSSKLVATSLAFLRSCQRGFFLFKKERSLVGSFLRKPMKWRQDKVSGPIIKMNRKVEMRARKALAGKSKEEKAQMDFKKIDDVIVRRRGNRKAVLMPTQVPGQQVPPEALVAHAAWVKGQKEVVVLMLLTMDLEI
ncbi:hypothetical protein Tco_0068125, partial [Tanacetum coccineum]